MATQPADSAPGATGFARILRLPALALMALFRLWQLTVSVVLPPSCRFTPSCSHYGIAALRRHGLLRGLWLTVLRVIRCNPWGGSGYDPVPEEFHLLPHRHGRNCAHRQGAATGAATSAETGRARGE